MRHTGRIALLTAALLAAVAIGVLVGNAYERLLGRPWIG